MGDTTDELLALAAAITDEPDARELDVLLATGEHQSATLDVDGPPLARRPSDQPDRPAGGHHHGRPLRQGAHRGDRPPARPRRARRRQGRHRRGVPGHERRAARRRWRTRRRPATSTPPRSRRSAAAARTRRRSRWPPSSSADRCQIFTDVTGIYTADPRIATEARQLAVVGYEEMMELAHQGAQVMQVRAVELGWVNDVVIEVLSSFEDAPGTQIREDPLVEQRNKVRGIAHDRNVAKITLVDVPDKPGVARSVFGPLADNGINVDMIVQNVGHGGATDLSFTIPRVELAKAKRILEPLIRDLGFRDMTTDSAVAKVSIVGAGIHNAPGYAARMFGTLADAGINIEMISTSEIRITTIISEDRVEEAVRVAPRRLRARAAGDRRGGRRRRGLNGPVTGRRPGDGPAEPLRAVRDRRQHERHRPRLAAGRHPGGLPRRRGRAGPGPRPPRPDLDRAPGRRAAAVARLPARPGSRRTAPGASRARRARDVRRGRGGGRPARGPAAHQVAQRPRRSRRADRGRSWPATSRPRPPLPGSRRRWSCASWPACSARAMASGRTTRASSSGIGINADWARDDFPPDIAAGMTSLRDASGGRPIDREALLDGVPRPSRAPASRPSAPATSTSPTGPGARRPPGAS